MDFGILAVVGLFINAVLFVYLNTLIIGLRTVLLDYTHKTNLLMAESRVEVPHERLVKIWRDCYAEAPEGSLKKQAYKKKLDEYYLLLDGNRYSE